MTKTSNLLPFSFFYRIRVYPPLVLIRFLVSELVLATWNRFVRGSYSQKKEDILIDELLGNKKKGFYVDVGASDPSRFSNTKRFYLRGWRGINIEPDSENIKRFYKDRERDINLNVGIGLRKGKMFFYRFIPSTLSTFSFGECKKNQREGYKLVERIKIPVSSLASVLGKYAGENEIDFLSVDTEGLDLTVLRSNDWRKFKPKVICVERSDYQAVKRYLSQKGYTEKYKNDINSIYLDER